MEGLNISFQKTNKALTKKVIFELVLSYRLSEKADKEFYLWKTAV